MIIIQSQPEQAETVRTRKLIEVRNLRVHFRGATSVGLVDYGTRMIRAVDGVSLDILQGEILSLVGESGSGKTTLGRTIIGLEKPTSGKILINEQEQKFDRKSLRKLWKTTQMIFQDPYSTFNPLSTVKDTLAIPLRKFGIAKSDSEVAEKIEQVLERSGLSMSEVGDKYPTQLSGGQRQRLAIARALIVDPQVIVADEPVSMLDVSLRAGILDLLVDLNRNFGLTILFITHDLAVAQYISSRIAVMYKGEIVELGASDEVMNHPKHPYTELLLKSAPRLKGEQSWTGDQSTAVRPSRSVLKGCSYFDRCPLAIDKCQKAKPALDVTDRGHYVSCFVRGADKVIAEPQET